MILSNADASPAQLVQLEPVFAAKHNLAGIDPRIQAKQASLTAITGNQKRVRDNLSALKGSAEERAPAKRYTGEMNAHEDQWLL